MDYLHYKSDVMQLELKHLAPYLPYSLKMVFDIKDFYPTHKSEIRDKDLTDECVHFCLMHCKPLLRPLTAFENDITNRIRRDGLTTYFWQCYDMDGGIEANILTCGWDDIQLLLSEHFDIFGLIPAGLALNIND